MTTLCFCGSASAATLASTTSVQAKSTAPLNGKAKSQERYEMSIFWTALRLELFCDFASFTAFGVNAQEELRVGGAM